MVPQTRADSRPVSSAPVEPGFPIDFVAVVWDGSGDGHDGAAVRFRRAGFWGRWQALELPRRGGAWFGPSRQNGFHRR